MTSRSVFRGLVNHQLETNFTQPPLIVQENGGESKKRKREPEDVVELDVQTISLFGMTIQTSKCNNQSSSKGSIKRQKLEQKQTQMPAISMQLVGSPLLFHTVRAPRQIINEKTPIDHGGTCANKVHDTLDNNDSTFQTRKDIAQCWELLPPQVPYNGKIESEVAPKKKKLEQKTKTQRNSIESVKVDCVKSKVVDENALKENDFGSSPRKEKLTELPRQDASGEAQESIYRRTLNKTRIISFLIIVLGASTSTVVLRVGTSGARKQQVDQFERNAVDLTNRIKGAWHDYATAASWIHNRCRSREFTRQDFRHTYEYLVASGLEFQAAQFDPYISHAERQAAENEARQFYAGNYPHVQYQGIVGFNTNNSTSVNPRHKANHYHPIHYMEPIEGNEAAIDLDYAASGPRRNAVMFCLKEGMPALTDRLKLVQERTEEETSYGVVLMHPGVKLSDKSGVWPKDLASIVIRVPDLLRRSVEHQREASTVYLHDKSDSGGRPSFLGAVQVVPEKEGHAVELTFLPEIEVEQLRGTGGLYHEEDINVANKIWTVSIVALAGTYQPNIAFVILGSSIVFITSIFLALWVYTNALRVEQFSKMKAGAEAEKTALMLENAKQATKAERELNDFIAHEVRNPVAAAMSACNLVRSAISEKHPLGIDKAIESVREDVDIIDNSLKFVNDLLRNMLDMHRASNNQLTLHMEPTDLLHDVLEPVSAILYQRNGKVKVKVECPSGLIVMADRLRLKQVMLNLGRNSVKFVQEGFICLRASTAEDQKVVLSVEDSGPGIPAEKCEKLFSKFQESLDTLQQGTGIGLFLCKKLVKLMEGSIYLDPDYHSGIPGCPGTKFVVDLHREAIDPVEITGQGSNDANLQEALQFQEEEMVSLPKTLEVLFVDDDPILRKLFARTVKRVAPGWNIREASSGETALKLCETSQFNLIFMDMYMASVEKQLLGSETVKLLRNRGVTSRICGLSANDKEAEFLEAGADAFTVKPFPCNKAALTQELLRILHSQ